jgi:hypothetical protein
VRNYQATPVVTPKAEIQFHTWERMLLSPEKIFRKLKKNSNENFHAYASTFYVRTSSFAKTKKKIVACVNKTKKGHVDNFFLHKNSLFYT